jgi:hypothetical protein
VAKAEAAYAVAPTRALTESLEALLGLRCVSYRIQATPPKAGAGFDGGQARCYDSPVSVSPQEG